MENLQVARAAPTPANVTVGRPREYLTEREVEKLMDAARGNRWGHRDATAILIAYRHGLRASELVALRWDDIDFQTGKLHVRRAKGGMASVHPLGAKELRALRRLQRETAQGVHVFVSERLAPLSVAGYQRMVARAGEAAKFGFSFTATCCAIAVGTSWPTMGRTLARSSIISVTGRLPRRCGTPLWRRIASRVSGRIRSGNPRGGDRNGSADRKGARCCRHAVARLSYRAVLWSVGL